MHDKRLLIFIHKGQIAQDGVGELHPCFQGEICYLLQGGFIHLIELLQSLQPGVVQQQGLFGILAVGDVIEICQEVAGLSRIVLYQSADHLCYVGFAILSSQGELSAPLASRK
ncbi:Uncharacterised protein [uncultured archaeon]|nr:Uncharacterised protein [uncultured archaeon]